MKAVHLLESFCTQPHLWICTSSPNPLSRSMPSTILRKSSSNSRGDGEITTEKRKKQRKKQRKTPDFSATNSQLTSGGLLPTLKIDCPNLKASFAPVFIWHFFQRICRALELLCFYLMKKLSFLLQSYNSLWWDCFSININIQMSSLWHYISCTI